jgi:hypothetical protein
MQMMSLDAVPRVKTIGILAGFAILLLVFSAWLIVAGGEGLEMYSFPPLLIGMVLLFMALVLFVLRAINLRQDQTPPGA